MYTVLWPHGAPSMLGAGNALLVALHPADGWRHLFEPSVRDFASDERGAVRCCTASSCLRGSRFVSGSSEWAGAYDALNPEPLSLVGFAARLCDRTPCASLGTVGLGGEVWRKSLNSNRQERCGFSFGFRLVESLRKGHLIYYMLFYFVVFYCIKY